MRNSCIHTDQSNIKAHFFTKYAFFLYESEDSHTVETGFILKYYGDECMLQLALLRHAKSSWEHENLIDHDRPLKERGHKDTALMANEMISREILPDAILSSTSRRTMETVETFLSVSGLPKSIVTYDRTLYHAWAKGILDFVKDNGSGSRLMVVGHNPGIHEFTEHMSDRRIEKFPTCALALLSLDITSWGELKYCCAELTEFFYPSMLR